MPFFKKLSYFLEYLTIRLLAFLLNLLPFSVLMRLARPMGAALFYLLGRSRRRALKHLKLAYPDEKSDREIRAIAKESFVRLAEFGTGWLRMSRIAQNPGRYLAIHGVEKIHRAFREKKKGAILLVSHVGNWEVMALIAGTLIARPVGASIYAVARPLKNEWLYRYVLRMRGLTGLKSIEKVGGMQETLSRLRENGIVSILIDQRIREGSIPSKFFGREALTTCLPALAARRLGTPVFHIFINQRPDLRYCMEVEGPVPLETSGDLRHDLEINTQRFNDRIEQEIRKDPSHWLWMHNRWRD